MTVFEVDRTDYHNESILLNFMKYNNKEIWKGAVQKVWAASIIFKANEKFLW